jgi:hypothetical protein
MERPPDLEAITKSGAPETYILAVDADALSPEEGIKAVGINLYLITKPGLRVLVVINHFADICFDLPGMGGKGEEKKQNDQNLFHAILLLIYWRTAGIKNETA